MPISDDLLLSESNQRVEGEGEKEGKVMLEAPSALVTGGDRGTSIVGPGTGGTAFINKLKQSLNNNNQS